MFSNMANLLSFCHLYFLWSPSNKAVFLFLLYCMFHSALCIATDVRSCLQYIEASLKKKKTDCSIALDFSWLLLSEQLIGYFWTILIFQKSLVCFRKSLIILHEINGSRIFVLCLPCPYSLCSLPYRINLLLYLLFVFLGMS